MSIPKLEKILEFSNGSIYTWKKAQPGLDKLLKIADYFDVSLDGLTGRCPLHGTYKGKKIAIAARNAKDDKEVTEEDIEILNKISKYLSQKGREALENDI